MICVVIPTDDALRPKHNALISLAHEILIFLYVKPDREGKR
jgi:hypothetical protein